MRQKPFLICLGALFAGISHSSFAQEYHPLIEENKVWHHADFVASVCDYQAVYAIMFMNADTILDGHNFQKIFYNEYASENEDYFCPPFTAGDSFNVGMSYFLREDIDSQQVYIWSALEDQACLLYDFSLNVGDTLHSEYAGMGTDLIVMDIELVELINGEERRKFHLSNDEYYIEGVGGSQGLLQPMIMGLGFWSYTLCLRENGESLFGESCTTGWLNSNDPEFSDVINMYPNPTIEVVNLDFDPSFTGLPCHIYIMGLDGRAVSQLDLRIEERGISIDTDELSTGIYLITVEIEGAIYRQKLFKI